MDNLSGKANWKLSSNETKKDKEEVVITTVKPKRKKVNTPNFSVLDTLLLETEKYYSINPTKQIGDILIGMQSLAKLTKISNN